LSKEWFQHNNLPNKLKAGLEDAINGQGLHIIFDGLQNGLAVVEVVYNGETCVFYNKNPPFIAPIMPLVETEAEDTMQYNEEQTAPKSKRKHKAVEVIVSEDT
jgi:hypothetical protein